MAMGRPRGHGRLLAGEVGELAGVSGTTIGQWARRGLIRSSQSDGEPRVYAVEDVAEAAVVADLLARGVRHGDLHALVRRLGRGYGAWPLSEAHLATTHDGGRPRIVLREDGDAWMLGARGWQQLAVVPALEDVRVRLHHRADG